MYNTKHQQEATVNQSPKLLQGHSTTDVAKRKENNGVYQRPGRASTLRGFDGWGGGCPIHDSGNDDMGNLKSPPRF